MAYNYITEKVLIWDNFMNKMTVKTAVSVQIIGTNGTVYAEEGPIFTETGQEIWEATQKLKELLTFSLLDDGGVIM